MRRNYHQRLNSIAPGTVPSFTFQHDGRIIAVQFSLSALLTLGAGDTWLYEIETSMQASAVGATSINPPSPVIAIAHGAASADIAGTSDVYNNQVNLLVPVDWRFQVGQNCYTHVNTMATRAGGTGVIAGCIIFHCETRN